VVLDVRGGSKEVVGFEEQVQGALLNLLINALEAMPEQGRLVISVDADAAAIMLRISDTGSGMQPQPDGRRWRPHFVNDPRQTAIGLHVTRAVVESHGGRIECASNVPRGTCIEIIFPTAASTGRLGHGSRTHR
jgi:signal transduction histidine kinase